MISPAGPLTGPDLSQVRTESGPFTHEALRRIWSVVSSWSRPLRWAEVNSLAATPWVAYTTTWANTGGAQPSIGDGTMACAYYRLGTTIHGYITITIGSTTTLGDAAGEWTFTYPTALGVAATDTRAYWVTASSTRARFFSTVIPAAGTATFKVYVSNDVPWSPTFPHSTVAAGDSMHIYFHYREA